MLFHGTNGTCHHLTAGDRCCVCMALGGHIRGLDSRIRSSLFSLLFCTAFPERKLDMHVLCMQ